MLSSNLFATAIYCLWLLFFQAAIDRDLPMYNVNPDITVNNPQGGCWYMPGLLAKRYEAMGGRVTYFGKPHKVYFGLIDPPRCTYIIQSRSSLHRTKPVRDTPRIVVLLFPRAFLAFVSPRPVLSYPSHPLLLLCLSSPQTGTVSTPGALRDRRGEDGPGQGEGGACKFHALLTLPCVGSTPKLRCSRF